ncbi:MAG: cobalamin biosynthesis protein [Proteobacteria bacterium]|nr:cobalamin biosynthesis protein [Pseudomonadota bacterium]
MWIASVIVFALLLDMLLAEPRRGHPLVGFGVLVQGYEKWARRLSMAESGAGQLVLGALGVIMLVMVPLLLLWLLQRMLPDYGQWLLDVVILYLAIGASSLVDHARRVVRPLRENDLPAARSAVARMVSRDTAALDETGIASATVESVLENGNDAVFASLFWYLLLGAPAVLVHRLLNTLDAMWGYRTTDYNYFGRTAARLDDVMAYVPARLTALSYSLLGKTASAWRAWRQQAAACASPNSGPVMAAGAGALGVQLGGISHYHGQPVTKPSLGYGRRAVAADIDAAIAMIRKTIILWSGLIVLAGVVAVVWN